MKSDDLNQDGYYWFRFDVHSSWRLCRVKIAGKSVPGFSLVDEHDDWSPLLDYLEDKPASGEFVGPIEPPV